MNPFGARTHTEDNYSLAKVGTFCNNKMTRIFITRGFVPIDGKRRYLLEEMLDIKAQKEENLIDSLIECSQKANHVTVVD